MSKTQKYVLEAPMSESCLELMNLYRENITVMSSKTLEAPILEASQETVSLYRENTAISYPNGKTSGAQILSTQTTP